MNLTLTSFYKFQPIEHPNPLREVIKNLGLRIKAKGLILLSHEGINGSICLETSHLDYFKSELTKIFDAIEFKDTVGTPSAYLKLKVKVRSEIVTMGSPELIPKNYDNHLTPEQWQDALALAPQILDVRNQYEIDIGKFESAQNLAMDDFSEFPEKLKSSGLDKNRNTLIYCTGGIRCEKAILEMRRQGFENVSQLRGGIIKYLEEYGSQGQFEGECFVFDNRVALTGEMKPSEKFQLCPHCGQPASAPIICKMCKTQQYVCAGCLQKDQSHETCSKNCAYHLREGHHSRKRQHLGTARS